VAQFFTRAAPAPAADAPSSFLPIARSMGQQAPATVPTRGRGLRRAGGHPGDRAAEGRVVQLLDYGPGCGLGVVLQHPEFKRYTAYCHLGEVLARNGEEGGERAHHRADRTTGNAAGVPHVHLELCTSACSSHTDGDLWARQTDEDRRRLLRPEAELFHGRLALTYPIPCGGLYRER